MIDIIFASTFSIVITIIALFSMLISVGKERFSVTTVLLVILSVTLFCKNSEELVVFYNNNWKFLLYFVLAYVPIGIFVALFKYNDLLKNKLNGEGLDYHSPSHHTDDIIGWIFYWPIVLVAYLVFDTLASFGEWNINQLSGAFNNIYKKYTK